MYECECACACVSVRMPYWPVVMIFDSDELVIELML